MRENFKRGFADALSLKVLMAENT